MARDPAYCTRKGAATAAGIILASNVTGSTFSCTRSRLDDSGEPNTMCCTRLYISLHVCQSAWPDTAAYLERVGLRVSCQVVQMCLEEPKCLLMSIRRRA